jgi:polysaccharide chain length determinant protein (PEP-CTERM system associated)
VNQVVEELVIKARGGFRYRWQGLGVTLVVGVLGLLLVSTIPNKFESKAQIFVDTSSILKPLLQGLAVATTLDSEADLVRRALLSRPTLDRVVKKTGLVNASTSPRDAEPIINALEKAIGISGDAKLNIYTITYNNKDARTAQAVVQALVDYFVEDSLGANRTDTTNAQRFLREQVAEYESRLSASEKRLAEFKQRNVGLMPDQRGDYFQRLQAETANYERARGDLAVAKRQRDEIRGKISVDVAPGGAPARPPTDSQISAATELDRHLQDARKQLDDLLLKYTDKHPDVLALRETIARLEARRQAELGGVRRTVGAPGRDGSAGVDEVLQNLQIRLNAADIEVAAATAKLDEADARVGELRRMIASGPGVEAELSRLNRDYGVTKTQYDQLLQRLETARISDEADKSQEVRFKVIEPPRLPLQPVSPPRTALVIFVWLAALGAGAAAAHLVSEARPVFTTARALESATGLPVAGVVSAFLPDEAIRLRSRAHAIFYVAIGVFLTALIPAIALDQRMAHAVSVALGRG